MADGLTQTLVCETCRIEKPFTVSEWPIRAGNPFGPRCRTCQRAYNRMFDEKQKKARVAARTQGIATLSGTVEPPASGTAVSKARDALPGELPLRQLEVAKALRAGAAVINEKAQMVLDKLFAYAGNEQSAHHEWALKLIAERLLPRKLYEDLGAKDAGLLAGEGNSRPSVTIIVQPATTPAPAESPTAVVVEGVATRVSEPQRSDNGDRTR